jgi:hypothetical protein
MMKEEREWDIPTFYIEFPEASGSVSFPSLHIIGELRDR